MSTCRNESVSPACFTLADGSKQSIFANHVYDSNGALMALYYTDSSGVTIDTSTGAVEAGACAVLPPDIELLDMCDVQADGSVVNFVRQVVTQFNASGVAQPPVVTDLEPDMTTAYAVTGAVGACTVSEPDVEFLYLCDVDPVTGDVANFVRRIVTSYDNTGAPQAPVVNDFASDGVTAYVVAGTITQCEARDSEIAYEPLCDKSATGEIITFFRRRTVNFDGLGRVSGIAVEDFAGDQVTPYVITGEVVDCNTCADQTPLGLITDLSALGDFAAVPPSATAPTVVSFKTGYLTGTRETPVGGTFTTFTSAVDQGFGVVFSQPMDLAQLPTGALVTGSDGSAYTINNWIALGGNEYIARLVEASFVGDQSGITFTVDLSAAVDTNGEAVSNSPVQFTFSA